MSEADDQTEITALRKLCEQLQKDKDEAIALTMSRTLLICNHPGCCCVCGHKGLCPEDGPSVVSNVHD